MPEPWASVLAGLVGPYGVIVALGVVIFFLWRLLREEQRDRKAAEARVDALVPAVGELLTIAKERRK